MTQSTKNIVLVHGGFVDGSGWESVYSLLKKDDYNVAIVQNPTLSLAGDVAATKLVINEQDGPVILVGVVGGVHVHDVGTHVGDDGLERAALAQRSGELRAQAVQMIFGFGFLTALEFQQIGARPFYKVSP